ncbi:protein canopy homolog 2 [Centruroides vittatus]|uniref:protein canopy homolog 2 n=1 Tax=Centruroides vittatus TaxID=120091 RepID=UPI00350F2A85
MEKLGSSCITFLLLFLITFDSVLASKEKKCLVCQQVIKDIAKEIRDENPHKTIQVGSFRIEPDGSQKQSTIKYAGSEVHLQEMFETICDKMNDYAQARHKETRKLAILNLATQINEIQNYDMIRDPDLNRSLKFYCESIIEDFEDDIIKVFKSPKVDVEEAIQKVCLESSQFCVEGKEEENLEEEEYHTDL